MLRRHLLCFTLPLFLFAAGCESDDGGANLETGPDLTGNWVVATAAVQKAPCESTGLGDTGIEAVTITQTGSDVVLEFATYAATGSLEGDVLTADGLLPGGEDIAFSLTVQAGRLEGNVRIEGDTCGEDRVAVLTPRLDDVDFSGHWEFDLDVIGEDGCDHIQDYQDCFRIFQDGDDLLVVDDDAGNLFGMAIGNVAEIVRDQPEEVTSLVFFQDPDAESLDGTAIRVFLELECRTNLVFRGVRSNQPCANFAHWVD